MQYGICQLSIVSVRSIPDDKGEMTSQLLYGEHFKILERRNYWSRIRFAFDGFEGWAKNNQLLLIDQADYERLETQENREYANDLVSFITTKDDTLLPIVLGSTINIGAGHTGTHEGSTATGKGNRNNLIQTALLYLNSPYTWGGKTPFGLDCSGFSQMTYKINGYSLKRSALEQSAQGEPLSFIEESEPGDLAFFDNTENVIDHVGIIMKDNYIIHVNGKVRIDRLDHTGIFNTEKNQYTHKLRVIKKII